MKTLVDGQFEAATVTSMSRCRRPSATFGLPAFVLLGALAGCSSDETEPDGTLPDTAKTDAAVLPPDSAPSDDTNPSIEAPVSAPAMDANPTIDCLQASSALDRELNPQVPEADMTTLASDNGAFAFDLYRKLKAENGNVVFSPASISIALAMTYAGAANATATEMAQALHFTLPQDRLHRAFNGLDQTLASRGQDLVGGTTRLNIVNSLWLEQTYPLLPSFLDVMALDYGAGVNLVSFRGAPDASRLKINAWVANNTAGKITDLLAPETITTNTKLVLANAVYFNAGWQNPFNALYNHTNNFTLLDGSIATKRYMYASLSAAATQGTNFVAVDLPYQDARLSMVVVVPDPGKFGDVEGALDWAALASLVKGMTYQKVSLTLPPFHLDTRASLPGALKSLGMMSAFCGSGSADFSGMSGTTDLCISEVIHQAFIDVAEKGTEAGAATAVVMVDTSIALDSGPPPLVVKADRPFLYFIYDNPTGTILFMGRVVDPVQI
jgi:serpin B